MQKVKFTQNYKRNKIGDIASVTNNEAHFLIENKYAILYREKMMKPVADKMMKSEESRELTDRGARRKKQIYRIK